MTYIRSLNTIEEAFTISNSFSPLYAVCILRLDKTFSVSEVKNALQKLQKRHLLLQAELKKEKSGWQFHHTETLQPISLEVLDRKTDEDWQQAAEKGLNTPFVKENSCLMRCIYVANFNENSSKSEILMVFHHSIIDSYGARLLLHEMLCLLGKVPLLNSETATIEDNTNEPPQFPVEFRNWSLKKKLLSFMAGQMKAEIAYMRKGLKMDIPKDSYNCIVSLRFNERESRQIKVASGRKNLSLNSLLSAAMLLAVHREVHAADWGLMRGISFASLREGMNRPIADSELGCHISMIRFNVPIEGNSDVWSVARYLQQQMYQAGKKGDLFLNAYLSKSLMQMMLRQNFMRLSNTALSYIGPLDLKPQYSDLQVLDVHAFITNNRLGPTFSGFGKILFGQIGLDCNYLASELSSESAQKIMSHIRQIIVENCVS